MNPNRPNCWKILRGRFLGVGVGGVGGGWEIGVGVGVGVGWGWGGGGVSEGKSVQTQFWSLVTPKKVAKYTVKSVI